MKWRIWKSSNNLIYKSIIFSILPLSVFFVVITAIKVCNKCDTGWFISLAPPLQDFRKSARLVQRTAWQLREQLPGVMVLPALGNHESVPVDSFPQPSVTGDPGRHLCPLSWELIHQKKSRHVLAVFCSGGGVGWVGGGGPWLDNQVRRQVWDIICWKCSHCYTIQV